jgi:hypothetical protein
VLSCAVCLLEMAIATAAKGDMRALGEDIAITHANTTSDEFAEWVRQWESDWKTVYTPQQQPLPWSASLAR